MKSWGVYILVALGVIGYRAMTSADRDDSGAIIGGGSVDAFEIREGDCFDDASSMDSISSLPAVPCTEPHDNEAYAVFDVSLSEYPGEDAMWEMAYDSCMDRFEGFVGKPYEESALDIFTMYPSPDSFRQNDREVVCAVFDMNANKLVGSAEGRAL